MRHPTHSASKDPYLLPLDGVDDGHIGDVKYKGSEAIAQIIGHQGFSLAVNHSVGRENTAISFIVSSTGEQPVTLHTRHQIIEALNRNTGAIFTDETGDGPEKLFGRFVHITKT